MRHNLELSVFRFDAKTDFLPYYKKYRIDIEGDESLYTLLSYIQEDDFTFDFPKEKYSAVNLNGKNLFISLKIDEIVENFGTTLYINPLSQKRAIKDLIIDKKDFYEKFDLIDPFVDSIDKKRFEELVIYHYASDIYRYYDEFVGDALLLFSYEMIKKYPKQKENILKIIANRDSGIFLHTPMCNKIYPKDLEIERNINRLKHQLISHRPYINRFIEDLSKDTI